MLLEKMGKWVRPQIIKEIARVTLLELFRVPPSLLNRHSRRAKINTAYFECPFLLSIWTLRLLSSIWQKAVFS